MGRVDGERPSDSRPSYAISDQMSPSWEVNGNRYNQRPFLEGELNLQRREALGGALQMGQANGRHAYFSEGETTFGPREAQRGEIPMGRAYEEMTEISRRPNPAGEAFFEPRLAQRGEIQMGMAWAGSSWRSVSEGSPPLVRPSEAQIGTKKGI